jgi:hypothetical protein
VALCVVIIHTVYYVPRVELRTEARKNTSQRRDVKLQQDRLTSGALSRGFVRDCAPAAYENSFALTCHSQRAKNCLVPYNQ